MKVKVCGMCDPANIAAVAALRPDYMGFIFYGRSPRYAGGLAPDVVRALPDGMVKVGVFVDARYDVVCETVHTYGLDSVQLHGDEPVGSCKKIRAICPVIKAVRVYYAKDIVAATEKYGDAVDYLLFDTRTPLYGGSGAQFDWDILGSYTGNTPFFLSGGIGPEDAARLTGLNLPYMHAIDINSRFEIRPGVKDAESLKQFFEEMNRQDKRI